MKEEDKLLQLPAFTRIKNVRAARIAAWAEHEAGYLLILEATDGTHEVNVSHAFARSFQPNIGDYFTVDEEGNHRVVSAVRFERDYRRSPDPKPIHWPEIKRLASMQPQAEFVTKMCEPAQRGGDIFGTRAQMDMILGKDSGR